MTEKGKVIKLKNNQALVRIDRKSACSGCGGCAFKPSDLYMDITLDNTLNAKIGDTVEVDIIAGSVAKMSIVAYLLPLVLAVLLLVAGVISTLPEWASILMFFGGLVIGFCIVATIDKLVYRKKENMPKMINIMTENYSSKEKGE
jgi:sigma-E factor negative regulatory protein RseC